MCPIALWFYVYACGGVFLPPLFHLPPSSFLVFPPQASFCGASQGELKDQHFTVQDYEEMGYNFCEALWDAISAEGRDLVNEVRQDLETAYPGKMRNVSAKKQQQQGAGVGVGGGAQRRGRASDCGRIGDQVAGFMVRGATKGMTFGRRAADGRDGRGRSRSGSASRSRSGSLKNGGVKKKEA